MGRFGELFKTKRIELGLTLRQFCLDNNLDPGNISKLERSILPPPQHEKLIEYAKLLKIKEGTDEWYQFIDLAAELGGKVPEDIMKDEAVVDKLPVLFRTLRGREISYHEVNALVNIIRGHLR